MSEGHSALGASSADRWMSCPGQPQFCASLPDDLPTEEAVEGTRAHKVCEIMLETGKPPKWADAEMIKAAKLYIDTIKADMAEMDRPELFVERKFSLEWLYPGMFGRNDAMLYEWYGLLRVYDFKYGKGHMVDVVNNSQLMYYGLGALQEFGDPEAVELIVVQPRATMGDTVKRWRVSPDDLRKWGNKVLKPAAEATAEKGAPLIPGDHCRFCKGMIAGKCPAYQKAMTKAVGGQEISPTMVLPDPELLTPDQLSLWLQSRSLLSMWDKRVEKYAMDLLRQGETVPGFKIVEGRSTRIWTDERGAAACAQSAGVEPYKTELLSPAQMETALRDATGMKAKDAKELINQFVGVKSGNPTLAPESDKRPALNLGPEAVFKVID